MAVPAFAPHALRSRALGALVLALVALAPGCASTASNQSGQSPASALQPWERAIDGTFENKGVAKIERLGPAWVLTVQCAGTHSTYLDATTIDLASYDAAYVRARYQWVERTVPDPRCVRAPCSNITQRMIALDRVEKLSITPQQATTMAAECKNLH